MKQLRCKGCGGFFDAKARCPCGHEGPRYNPALYAAKLNAHTNEMAARAQS